MQLVFKDKSALAIDSLMEMRDTSKRGGGYALQIYSDTDLMAACAMLTDDNLSAAVVERKGGTITLPACTLGKASRNITDDAASVTINLVQV